MAQITPSRADSPPRKRWVGLGPPVDVVDMAAALHWADQAMSEGRGGLVVTPNPEIIVSAWHRPELATVIAGSDLSLPDGVGVVMASRILGGPLTARVPGIEFLEGCLKLCAARHWPVFLLGGGPGVAQDAAEQAVRRWPGLKVAGTHHGYFGPQDTAEVLQAISGAAPKLLAVGMGHPRQELWLATNLAHLPGVLGIACGGSLDALAGRVLRAPAWVQRIGLEWLYRVAMSPRARVRRLWPLTAFAFQVIRSRLTGAPLPGSSKAR